MAKGFFYGVLTMVVALSVGAVIFVTRGWMPANADATPPALEKWMARASLRAALQREAPQAPNPVPFNDENLVAGIKIYSANCAVCHGASDGTPSNIALGLYQHAPQLAQHGVTDDPEGKIYWFVKHGVRLTGMPAYTDRLTDQQIWQVVLFLKHMDGLTAEANKTWRAVPSQATRL
jgi:mono/diheme cytochrome c family protein